MAKKGHREKAKDHTGLTHVLSMYKLHAMALAKRLEKEVEERKMIPHIQVGFRKAMGMVDNILNYLANREIWEKGG